MWRSPTMEQRHDRELRLLSRVFEAPYQAFAIHYALQQLLRDQRDHCCPIAAITVRNLGTDETKVFSIKSEAELAGVNLRDDPGRRTMIGLEYCLLYNFNEFLERHTASYYVHWHMTDERFGFCALENRFTKLLAEVVPSLSDKVKDPTAAAVASTRSRVRFPVRVPAAQKLDLATIVSILAPTRSVSLRQLATWNGLNDYALVQGEHEPELFETRNLARLQSSTAAKTRLIGDIARLAYSGRLRVKPWPSTRSGAGTTRIFINYRREDTEAAANWLHDRLSAVFGTEQVFIDTDDIPAGLDFVDFLEAQIAACDVFLAVIGRRWTTAENAEGRLRLSDPDDFVRREIAAALGRDIPLIPVLVDGTPMPSADQLPEALHALGRRQAVDLRIKHFAADVERLIAKIRHSLGLRADKTAIHRSHP